ncbi:hypothetical protein [Streptomyces sp. NPDC059916]|uniref:hypothetical protein n=1 Tax=Streptomyces sp. NPDC059916 TaxID=3347001 RepID=UPI0036C52BCE
MAMDGYLALGGVEITNEARLDTYLRTVGSPLVDHGSCGCPTFTAETLGDEPYSTPAEDGAPWYDPDVPESADFAGFRVLSIDGLDEYPVRRSSTNAVTGGAALGPGRVMPRTITITGILLGATCCAVEYGLHWLSEAMTGCTGSVCEGDCLTLFNCCPGEEEAPEAFRARHQRTVRRVALAQGPTPTARHGNGCTSGACSSGADIITVEIVLTAGTPWLWTDPTPILEVALPDDDSDTCVTWCVHGQLPPQRCVDVVESCPVGTVSATVIDDAAACTGLRWPVGDSVEETCDGTCRFAPCVDPTTGCTDPLCAPPVPPSPAALETCYCLPLAVEKVCYDMVLSDRPGWSVDVPVITLRAGREDLRNVTVTFYERPIGGEALTCEEVAEFSRCYPHSQYHVAYVPAGGAVTIDGQIGRSIVQCGADCETSRDVYGLDGAPPTYEPFNCADYCVCIETDVMNPPARNAVLILSVSGRGY